MAKKNLDLNKRDELTKVFLQAGDDEINEFKLNQFKVDIWSNLREKKQGGLRLTDFGYKYLKEKAEIKSYEIPLPENLKLTPQILIWLDNFIESPYYLDKKELIVFTEKSAFELHLFSGDVAQMGYAKAMAKRLDQI